MQIEKYIEELTKLRQAHGPELEVLRTSATGFASKAGLPRLAYRQQGHRNTLFREGQDPDRLKGEKVVVV